MSTSRTKVATKVSPIPNGQRCNSRTVVNSDMLRVEDLLVGSSARIVTITPSVASKILAQYNTGNRHLGDVLARYYANLMKDGYWKLNGETLIFASTGRVLDGQHRLLGCVMADVPFQTWVVLGADPTTFDTIGRGKKRKTSDDLGIEGEKNTSCLAAALALIWLDESGRIVEIGQTPPSSVARAVLRNHPHLRESVNWTVSHHSRDILQPRIAAYCHYRFHQKSPEKATSFFEKLHTGIGLTDRRDPVYHLRERLLADRIAKARLKPTEVLALVIKGWNHHVNGTGIRYLRWSSDEPFPGIMG